MHIPLAQPGTVGVGFESSMPDPGAHEDPKKKLREFVAQGWRHWRGLGVALEKIEKYLNDADSAATEGHPANRREPKQH